MEGGIRVDETLLWARDKDLHSILEFAISLETNSYDLYIKMGRRVEGDARKVFSLLADEEKRHLERLAALLEKEVLGTRETELSYFLFPEFWGRGYATEAMLRVVQFAAEGLEVTSMIAVIDPHNAPSQSVAERLGMRFERAVPRSDGVTRHLYRLTRHSAARPALQGLA